MIPTLVSSVSHRAVLVLLLASFYNPSFILKIRKRAVLWSYRVMVYGVMVGFEIGPMSRKLKQGILLYILT